MIDALLLIQWVRLCPADGHRLLVSHSLRRRLDTFSKTKQHEPNTSQKNTKITGLLVGHLVRHSPQSDGGSLWRLDTFSRPDPFFARFGENGTASSKD